MPSTLRIAVVGGGWAGLAAAVELTAAGAAVTVFEAARQLGGHARGVEIDGQRLDNGQHILIGAYRKTLRLMRQVGAVVPGRRPARCARQQRRRKTRRHSLHTSPAGAGLSPGDGLHGRPLLDQHGQFGALRRYLWEPLCVSALNTAPENACARIFANVLRDSFGGSRADTDMLLPASDLGELFPSAAARFIRARAGAIRLSTRVDALDADLGIAGERFAHVVLAAHAPTAATAGVSGIGFSTAAPSAAAPARSVSC